MASTDTKPLDFSKEVDLSGLSESLKGVAGMVALVAGARMALKVFEAAALTSEQRRVRRRIRAARKVTPFSVKRWKAGRMRR